MGQIGAAANDDDFIPSLDQDACAFHPVEQNVIGPFQSQAVTGGKVSERVMEGESCDEAELVHRLFAGIGAYEAGREEIAGIRYPGAAASATPLGLPVCPHPEAVGLAPSCCGSNPVVGAADLREFDELRQKLSIANAAWSAARPIGPISRSPIGEQKMAATARTVPFTLLSCGRISPVGSSK